MKGKLGRFSYNISQELNCELLLLAWQEEEILAAARGKTAHLMDQLPDPLRQILCNIQDSVTFKKETRTQVPENPIIRI